MDKIATEYTLSDLKGMLDHIKQHNFHIDGEVVEAEGIAWTYGKLEIICDKTGIQYGTINLLANYRYGGHIRDAEVRGVGEGYLLRVTADTDLETVVSAYCKEATN